MGPIQYLPQQAVDPTQAAFNGYALGDQIRQHMLARAQAEEQARRQREADQYISGVMSSPNATLEQYGQVLALNPKLRESVELVTKRRSEEQNAASLRDMGQVYSALTMGRPDVAKQLLQRRAEALGNTPGSGEQRALARAMIEQLDADPVQVRNGLGVMLAAAPGGKDVIEALGKLGAEQRAAEMQPLELAAKRSANEKAAVEARFAESNAVIDLSKKGWDIVKLRDDMRIAQLNANIAAAQVAAAKESNNLRNQEINLRIQDMQRARDTAVKETEAKATGQFQLVSEAKSLISEILDPKNKVALRDATGVTAFMAAVPGSPERDMAKKIERLSNLLTVDNIKLMTGVLTDRDMEVLRSVGGNFDRYMRTGTVIKELERANTSLDVAQRQLVARYGQPPPAIVAPRDDAQAPGGAARPGGTNVTVTW